jgi:hypothetical protein
MKQGHKTYRKTEKHKEGKKIERQRGIRKER